MAFRRKTVTTNDDQIHNIDPFFLSTLPKQRDGRIVLRPFLEARDKDPVFEERQGLQVGVLEWVYLGLRLTAKQHPKLKLSASWERNAAWKIIKVDHRGSVVQVPTFSPYWVGYAHVCSKTALLFGWCLFNETTWNRPNAAKGGRREDPQTGAILDQSSVTHPKNFQQDPGPSNLSTYKKIKPQDSSWFSRREYPKLRLNQKEQKVSNQFWAVQTLLNQEEPFTTNTKHRALFQPNWNPETSQKTSLRHQYEDKPQLKDQWKIKAKIIVYINSSSLASPFSSKISHLSHWPLRSLPSWQSPNLRLRWLRRWLGHPAKWSRRPVLGVLGGTAQVGPKAPKSPFCLEWSQARHGFLLFQGLKHA